MKDNIGKTLLSLLNNIVIKSMSHEQHLGAKTKKKNPQIKHCVI
jgi:hypothetical protein